MASLLMFSLSSKGLAPLKNRFPSYDAKAWLRYSLLWSNLQDTVAKGAEADGRVVVCLRAVVEVDFKEGNLVPYWC